MWTPLKKVLLLIGSEIVATTVSTKLFGKAVKHPTYTIRLHSVSIPGLDRMVALFLSGFQNAYWEPWLENGPKLIGNFEPWK
jgi:hypothetical protein